MSFIFVKGNYKDGGKKLNIKSQTENIHQSTGNRGATDLLGGLWIKSPWTIVYLIV